jgi:hypothetical protein
VVARVAEVIRIEEIWLAVEPLDMRAGTETALGRVVRVFGAAHPHQAYPQPSPYVFERIEDFDARRGYSRCIPPGLGVTMWPSSSCSATWLHWK